MVAILLPAARIASGRLQRTTRVRTNPDVGPCWRNRQLRNPLQLGGAANSPASEVVFESEPSHRAGDAWTPIGPIAQACRARGLDRVERHRWAPAGCRSV